MDPVPGHRAHGPGHGGGRARLLDAGRALARARCGAGRPASLHRRATCRRAPRKLLRLLGGEGGISHQVRCRRQGSQRRNQRVRRRNLWADGAFAEAQGLDPEKDIKLVETGFPASEDAIRAGRVDVGVLNQPFAARAEAKGGLRKLFSLSDQLANIVHILEVCRKDFVDKNPELATRYVRDMTRAMQMAVSNREETLKVVSEVTKAPLAVLDTYLLKPNDFAREPGA